MSRVFFLHVQNNSQFKMFRRVFANKLGIQAGGSALMINNFMLDVKQTDIFELVDLLRNEAKLLEGLKNIGIDDKKIFEVIYFSEFC